MKFQFTPKYEFEVHLLASEYEGRCVVGIRKYALCVTFGLKYSSSAFAFGSRLIGLVKLDKTNILNAENLL